MNPILSVASHGLDNWYQWNNHNLGIDIGNISTKPVPRWPERASYRTQIRDARRRRNVQKRGGAK